MAESLNLESILLPGIEEKRPLIIAGPCSAMKRKNKCFLQQKIWQIKV